MDDAPRQSVVALLAKIDRENAEAEALSVEPATDEMRIQLTKTLAELKEARRVAEGELREA